MGQLLSRVLMWAIIIGSVWYFAQLQQRTEPDEQAREAMLEAAQHYQQLKARSEKGPAEPILPVSAPDR